MRNWRQSICKNATFGAHHNTIELWHISGSDKAVKSYCNHLSGNLWYLQTRKKPKSPISSPKFAHAISYTKFYQQTDVMLYVICSCGYHECCRESTPFNLGGPRYKDSLYSKNGCFPKGRSVCGQKKKTKKQIQTPATNQ